MWFAPSLLAELVDVHEQLRHGPLHLLLGDEVFGVLRTDDPVRPLEDLVSILFRHTDQLGDHFHGQPGRDVDATVAGAFGDGAVVVSRYRFSAPDVYTMSVQQAPISKPRDGLPVTSTPLE